MAAFRVRRTYSFTCLPESLIRNVAISDRAVRLWALLDRYAKGDDYVSLTREVLAADLACSSDSIDRALAELVRFGWLTHNGARGGRPREYQLWINEEVRTDADNLLRAVADNSPQGCGQPSAPVRTTPAADLGKRRGERESREYPPNPPTGVGGDRAHQGQHKRCRPCGTAGRPPKPQPPSPLPVADALARSMHPPGHDCATCRKEGPS